MGTPSTIPIAAYSIAGRTQGSYPATNPNRNYLTAAAYTPVTDSFPIEFITMQSANGYHAFASTHFEYKAYIGFTGGRAPYRVSIFGLPGATIGASGNEQTMQRTLDVIGGGVYRHDFPTNFNTIRWTPTVGQIGSTFNVTALVEDSSGKAAVQSFSILVDNTKFIFVDGTVADDSGAGTWAAPKKTFAAAHVNNGKICVYKTAGTYAVTFGGLNNSDNLSRQHIGLVPGVVFDMSTQQFGCSTKSDDVAFINIEFNGSVVSNANCRVFNMSGKTDNAIWWGCRWRNVSVGTNSGDNPGCVAMMSLGNPPGTNGATGVGSVRDLPDAYSHRNITFAENDGDITVHSQLFMIFGGVGVCVEKNTCRYPVPYISGSVNSNGAQFIHLKDGCSRVAVRFNVCAGGAFSIAAISFSNQRAFWCYQQEASYNIIKWSDAAGISFNRQATVDGDTLQGQRKNAEDTRCIRNTCISTIDGAMEFARWEGAGGTNQPVVVEGNLVATTNTNILTPNTIADGGATLVGVNAKLAASDFDASMKLIGAARVTHLGKAGGEIASTLVN